MTCEFQSALKYDKLALGRAVSELDPTLIRQEGAIGPPGVLLSTREIFSAELSDF